MLVAACLAVLSRAVTRGPRDDVLFGVAAFVNRVYCRAIHGLRVEGIENLPAIGEKGLLVVANHTAGIDPLVVQAALPFYVRWLMMESMMLPLFGDLWDWLEVIPVAGNGRELASARSAMRAVASGAAVGIFPEGGIERPAQALQPFIPGVGLIIAKTGAPVLPVIIEGAPYTRTAWGSLFKPSRTRLRIMPVVRYRKDELKPEQIARDLEERYAAWTGWPMASRGEGVPTRRDSARPSEAESHGPNLAAPGRDRRV